MKTKNKNKVVWITGASSGIGKATAKLLLLNKYTVYAADNRSKNMDDLKQLGAFIIKMDPCNDGDLQSGIDEIIANDGQIDMLINGAGFATLNTPEEFSTPEAEYQFESNAFDWARIIELALPYMKKQKSGKIVNIVSSYHNNTRFFQECNNEINHLLRTVNVTMQEEATATGVNLMLIESKVVESNCAGIKIQNNVKHLYAMFNKKMDHVKMSFLKLNNSDTCDTKALAETVLKSIADPKAQAGFHEEYLNILPQFFKNLSNDNKPAKSLFREMA